ncbi:MAG TPA: hypothetical protein VJT84_06905 [Gaiellaceae bacterium]|nr:hypothetical protein [Gaiellaceae bacterium]
MSRRALGAAALMVVAAVLATGCGSDRIGAAEYRETIDFALRQVSGALVAHNETTIEEIAEDLRRLNVPDRYRDLNQALPNDLDRLADHSRAKDFAAARTGAEQIDQRLRRSGLFRANAVVFELPAEFGAADLLERLKPTLATKARRGAIVFVESGCLNCHLYRSVGATRFAAPDLTHQALRRRGTGWQVNHLRCPSCLVPGSKMPSFDNLDPRSLRVLALFLESSR